MNELVNEGEVVVDDSKTGELLSGEDIRIILMKGDVIRRQFGINTLLY